MNKGLRKFDRGKRIKKNTNYQTYGQLKVDRPDHRKSPFSVLYYNMRFDYEDDYPAKFNRDLCNDMLLLYTEEGDIVLDPFVGSGISILQAGLLGRNGLGYDINAKAIDICRRKAEAHKNLITGKIKFERADARAIQLEDMSVKFILTSPPFGTSIDAKHINYSDSEDDLGNSKDYDVFLSDFRKCIQEMYRVLDHNGICIIEMRDRAKGLFVPMGALTMIEMIKAGFEPWAMPVCVWYPYRMWPYGPEDARKFLPAHANLCIGRKTGKKGLVKFFGL